MMNKTSVAKAIDAAVNNGITVNTDDDLMLLNNHDHTWDELNGMKDSVASSVLTFTMQVHSLLSNQDIMGSLGVNQGKFRKLIEMFFSDINNFSLQVKNLREQHEHKSGRVTSMSDYDLYNRLSINYASLMTELSAVIAPTLGEIMLIVSEVEQLLRAQSVDVVTDVNVKPENGHA